MYIQTETTPNPETLKFLAGVTVLKSGSVSFTSLESAASSPLAKRIFGVEDVAGVFLAQDFITVTKAPEAHWEYLKPLVLSAMMEHFLSGMPTVDGEETDNASSVNDDDDEIVKQIKELLDTRVRPAVANDGGDIIFDRFEDGILYLQMHGACSGCPSSTATLKSGIENMMRHYVPEVEEVRAA